MSASSSENYGCIVAIVGASGVGKDTLINAARLALAADPRFGFVQRVITRPADAGGEEHITLSREAFEAERKAGAFALHWHAHGLDYGIPAAVYQELAQGRVMVANVSRREVPLAELAFPRLAVIEVTAPAAVLAERLAARGRESAAEIETRLAREVPLVVARARHVVIRNDRPLPEVTAEFIAAIRAEVG